MHIDGSKRCVRFVETFCGEEARIEPKLVRYLYMLYANSAIVRAAINAAGPERSVFSGLTGLCELHVLFFRISQAEEVALILEQVPSLEVISIRPAEDEPEDVLEDYYHPLLARTWLAIQRLPNLHRLHLEGLSLPSIGQYSLATLQRLALQNCEVDPQGLSKILSATSEQ